MMENTIQCWTSFMDLRHIELMVVSSCSSGKKIQVI